MTWDKIGPATRLACKPVSLEDLAGKIVVVDLAGAFYTAALRSARQLFHSPARRPEVVASVTDELQKLLDAGSECWPSARARRARSRRANVTRNAATCARRRARPLWRGAL